MSGEAEAEAEAGSGSGRGVAASPVAEGSRRERPGCGRNGAVRGPGGLERAPWRGRAGPGLASGLSHRLSPPVCCRSIGLVTSEGGSGTAR